MPVSLMLKRIASKLHLLIGLVTGTVVLIICLTASVYVWEQELNRLVYAGQIDVQVPANPATLPLAQLKQLASDAVGKPVKSVEISADAGKAWQFRASKYHKDSAGTGFSYLADVEYDWRIWVNPYSGHVQGVQDMRFEPIRMLRTIHQQLLLRDHTGTLIVGINALCFLVMVLSGIVLWFPGRWSAVRKRLVINARTNTKRTIYDLHSVGGIWVHLILLVSIVTGLAWPFKWWESGIYTLLGQEGKPSFGKDAKLDVAPLAFTSPMETFTSLRPSWHTGTIAWEPAKDGRPAELKLTLKHDIGSGWDESDLYFFDASTSQLLRDHLHTEKTTGEKWRNSNYAIHTGGIGGWPTKVLASFAALVGASLPVTGFLIWWGRRRKR